MAVKFHVHFYKDDYYSTYHFDTIAEAKAFLQGAWQFGNIESFCVGGNKRLAAWWEDYKKTRRKT